MRCRRKDGVHEKTVGDTFFLHGPGRMFYSFDGIGRDIWDLLVAGRTVDEIVQEICAAYDAEAGSVREDVLQLVRDVLEQGLVEPVEGALPRASS
jgi:hypothetical protein